MIGILWILFLIVLLPFVIGIPWMHMIESSRTYAFAYSVGFFLQLAIFQIVSMPVVLLHGSFQTVAWLFSAAMLMLSVWSLYYVFCNKPLPPQKKRRRLSVYEAIYLIALLFVIGIQISGGVTRDITYMANDDGVYTVTAQQALEGQGLGTVHWTFGEAMPLNIHYGISGWLYYPAYIAWLSGVSVTMTEHTVLYIQLIILAYTVYWYMAGKLFAKRENALIFMLFISLLYLYGYHSHYSLTFRLLGPNYQGKAVLAVSLTPLFFTLLIKKLQECFQWHFFFLLVLLSITACCLTLWGVGTIIIIVGLPVLISFFTRDRCIKHILYIVACTFFPIFNASLYFLSRYGV